MTSQFDASFVYTGPLSAELRAAHVSEIEGAMFMLSKLANAKLHANNELQRWVLACNRLVWGGMPTNPRQPEQSEIALLLEQLSPENRERLLKESQLAAEARNLVAMLSAAEEEAQKRLEAQRAEEAQAELEARVRHDAYQAELARAEALRTLWQEFEITDAEGKEVRFQTWLAQRQREP